MSRIIFVALIALGRPQDFVSGSFVIEGTVLSKRTYAKGGWFRTR